MESVKPSKIILFIVLFARSGKRSIKDLCAILLMKIFQKFFFCWMRCKYTILHAVLPTIQSFCSSIHQIQSWRCVIHLLQCHQLDCMPHQPSTESVSVSHLSRSVSFSLVTSYVHFSIFSFQSCTYTHADRWRQILKICERGSSLPCSRICLCMTI